VEDVPQRVRLPVRQSRAMTVAGQGLPLHLRTTRPPPWRPPART